MVCKLVGRCIQVVSSSLDAFLWAHLCVIYTLVTKTYCLLKHLIKHQKLQTSITITLFIWKYVSYICVDLYSKYLQNLLNLKDFKNLFCVALWNVWMSRCTFTVIILGRTVEMIVHILWCSAGGQATRHIQGLFSLAFF